MLSIVRSTKLINGQVAGNPALIEPTIQDFYKLSDEGDNYAEKLDYSSSYVYKYSISSLYHLKGGVMHYDY